MNKLLIATLASSLLLFPGIHAGAQTDEAGTADTSLREEPALPSADVDTPGSPPSISTKIAGREVQLHGYLSVGFARSTGNNYLRMNTSQGSPFTESGLTVSSPITNKFRVGAQLYNRYIGELGKGRVYLDWAFADYRLKDWIGLRGGKIKTSLGLYTDTQDQAFLHTWALLPQSVYPVDWRAVTVAHVGGDVYGTIRTGRGGSLSYTGFVGSIPGDPRGGFLYGVEAQGGRLTTGVMGRMAGFDLRWDSPIAGLMMGGSVVNNHRSFNGFLGASPVPLSYATTIDRAMVVYGDYTKGPFHAAAEYRDQTRRAELTAEIPGRPVVIRLGADEPAWFSSAAYRFSRRMEVGGYYSHYRVSAINQPVAATGLGRDHIFDKAVAMRVDLAPFWVFKIEGHFIDGVGASGQAHGFYPQDNPDGLEPTTRMLVLRTSWYF